MTSSFLWDLVAEGRDEPRGHSYELRGPFLAANTEEVVDLLSSVVWMANGGLYTETEKFLSFPFKTK